MTKLLKQAITEAKKLSEAEQDAVAALILEELKDEASWDEAFKNSQDSLAKLAATAIIEDRTGNTEELDPDKL